MEIIKFNDFMSGNYGKHRYNNVEIPMVSPSVESDMEVIELLGEFSIIMIKVLLILFAVKFSFGVALTVIKTLPITPPLVPLYM